MADLYEVLVDRYGHDGEWIRGDLATAADLAAYDLAHLTAHGVVRRVGDAEAAVLIAAGAGAGTRTTRPPDDTWARELHGHGLADAISNGLAEVDRIEAEQQAARVRVAQIAAELGGGG